MNSGVKSDNMTKSIICCTSMKKEEIIKAADKPRQPTQTMYLGIWWSRIKISVYQRAQIYLGIYLQFKAKSGSLTIIKVAK